MSATMVGFRAMFKDLCQLLRDIFPSTVRPPPPIAPEWLAWNNSTIPKLAAQAYDERALPAGTLDNDRLAVLADALEDAGCQSTELLEHLRGPGPHWRGCAALDAVLGKE